MSTLEYVQIVWCTLLLVVAVVSLWWALLYDSKPGKPISEIKKPTPPPDFHVMPTKPWSRPEKKPCGNCNTCKCNKEEK